MGKGVWMNGLCHPYGVKIPLGTIFYNIDTPSGLLKKGEKFFVPTKKYFEESVCGQVETEIFRESFRGKIPKG